MLRRRGFLTYLLLGAMVVVGILVFALQNYARQQNRFAHRIGYGQVCESAARSGLTVLSTRFRENFRRSGKMLPLLAALGNTRFAFFVASRPEQITQRFGSLGANSDAIFRSLLGPDYRLPLDEMVERYPGMQVELAIEVKGEPLYTDVGVTDPVEKIVTMTLTAKAMWMDVTRRVSTGFEVRVVHPAPPLAAKFTLFAPEAANNWNTVVNDGDGKLLDGSSEIAELIHTPFEDVAAGLDDEHLIDRKADAGTVRAAMGNRGHVYLGGAGAINLNLTAGVEGAGQFFQLYDPDRVKSGKLWTKLFFPPGFFNGYVAANRDWEQRQMYENPDHEQFPNLWVGYFGFYDELRTNPLFGTSMVDNAKSASLHIFGTADDPSRTVVWGDVHQAMARIGRIGFVSFEKAAGRKRWDAPLKSGYDGVPYLPFCPDAESYAADLRAEATSARPQYLADIRGKFGAGAPGILAPFQLDPNLYTHERMFGATYLRTSPDGKSDGYGAYMTKVERMPYAEVADAMQYPDFFPPHTGTMVSVLEQPYAAYTDVSAVELPFTDSLHRQLGQAQYFKGNLATFFTRPTPDGQSPAEVILRARSLREFATQDDFFATCALPGSRNLLLFDTVRIREGGLDLRGWTLAGMGHIFVEKGNVISGGLANVKLPDGLPSLITIAALDGDIELAGGAPHDAHWMALNGTVKVTGSGHATVSGGIAAKTFAPSSIGGGLRVEFPSKSDPTRTDDSESPRFHDYYIVGLGQVPVSVERLP